MPMNEKLHIFYPKKRLGKAITKFKEFLPPGFSEVNLFWTVGGAATYGGSLRMKQGQRVAQEHASDTFPQLSKCSLVITINDVYCFPVLLSHKLELCNKEACRY